MAGSPHLLPKAKGAMALCSLYNGTCCSLQALKSGLWEAETCLHRNKCTVAATAFFQSDCLQLSDFGEYVMSALRIGINYEPNKWNHSHLGSESTSLVSVKLLYFPILIYYLWNPNVNFWFCGKEHFYNELVNVKALQFSKIVVSWRSVSSVSVDYLDSYFLTLFFIKLTHAWGPQIFSS